MTTASIARGFSRVFNWLANALAAMPPEAMAYGAWGAIASSEAPAPYGLDRANAEVGR